MKIVSLVTQKGGSGKSTLARHIAVAAHLDGLKAVILDCDMQGSLRDWGEAREAPDPAVMVELSPNQRHIEGKVDSIREAGTDFLVIDTPGSLLSPIALIAAGLSDLVVVPVRPTDDDVKAFWPLLPRLQASKKPMGVVLSACPTTTARPRLDTVALLAAERVPVAPVAIHDKRIVPDSAVEGLTVLEMDLTSEPERKTLREFQDLYAWVSTTIKGKH